MDPPPPPPPPTPGTPAPLSASFSSGPSSPATGTRNTVTLAGGVATVSDHNDQLMAAIRGGINLKPTKTNDRSTAGFIKRANGPLNENGTAESDDPTTPDKPCSIDEMKDALQAELRNTLKRKIKQQNDGQDDCRKNDEIERSIEHTRNEVQLKLNGPSPTPGGPKVDNPLKSLVDMVDKECGPAVGALPLKAKQSSPVATPKTQPPNTSAAPNAKSQPMLNGTGTLRKVSAGQSPIENGKSSTVVISPTPWKSTSPSTPIVANPAKTSATLSAPISTSTAVPNGNKSPQLQRAAAASGTVLKSPASPGKTSPGASPMPSPQSSTVAKSTASKINTSHTVIASSPATALSSSSPNVPNGNIVTGTLTTPNSTAIRNGGSNMWAPKTSTSTGSTSSNPAVKVGSYYNTLPRSYGTSSRKNASPVAVSPMSAPTSGMQPVFNSTVKISLGGFEDSARPFSNGGRPIVRNGAPSKIEPLTIDTTSNGSSTNGTSSPSTPRELLSPQVRNGAASIRPSQIRTLTKAGSVVSHTDIRETPKPIAKLPVSLIEPAPVLTAAAAVSPPPSSPKVSPVTTGLAKEHAALFEKAPSAKEPLKSPFNRWVDSSSVSGGTARKLLLNHGRPNFTVKRSNSRQGFDVDVPDSSNDTVKPVFRILTDLERMESEQEQHQQQGRDQADVRRPSAPLVNGGQQPHQQYVSFAKDLSNAPNNHPDVAVVMKTVVKPRPPADPFLATLKDIKIDIGEMKVVNTRDN